MERREGRGVREEKNVEERQMGENRQNGRQRKLKGEKGMGRREKKVREGRR